MTDLEFILSKSIRFLLNEDLTSRSKIREKFKDLTEDPRLISFKTIGNRLTMLVSIGESELTLSSDYRDDIQAFSFYHPDLPKEKFVIW